MSGRPARRPPSRRDVLKGTGAAAALSLAPACRSDAPTGRPNVILLISDQHRADALGLAGNSAAITPSIDRLAREGTTFDTAYCQSPLCVPARQSLVTGRHPHGHGTFGNVLEFPEAQVTLPEHLTRHGYQTAMIGKAHVNVSGFGHVVDKAAMFRAFEAEHPGAAHPGDYFTRDGSVPYAQAMRASNPRTLGPGEGAVHHMERDVVAGAREWLAARDPERPFFLWASFVRPHPPRFPPEEWAARFRGASVPNWGVATAEDVAALFRYHHETRADIGIDRATASDVLGIARSYYASVSWTDQCIGELVSAVDAMGLGDDTIVVYTSDHGEMLGDHGMLGKFTLFEAATRVPLVVRWPGRLDAGRRIGRVVQHIDFTRTLTEWLDVPDLPGAEGRSLAPLIEGAGDAAWEDTALSELYHGRDNFAETPRENIPTLLREDAYKYVWNNAAEEALYALDEDPEERRNLIAETSQGGRVEALRDRVREALPERVFVRAYKR